MSWAVRACSPRLAMMARTSCAAAGAAARHVHTGRLGVLMLGFPGAPLVQIRGVGVAAAGQHHVQQGAGGGVAEYGVGGVGGDALGGVHDCDSVNSCTCLAAALDRMADAWRI